MKHKNSFSTITPQTPIYIDITVSMCLQPFSSGLVTVMVPQLRRENSLLLWSTLDLNSPVHAFVGHDDVVLEFQWRPQKEGEQPRSDSESR